VSAPSPAARDTAAVVQHSEELRRELGVADLLLAQIIMIVGGTWVGTAGKLGASHLCYWMIAAALFFAPLVAVVLFLNRWAPLEGGLYQWAKLAFGEAVGFLVAFNLWLWAVVLLASIGLEIVVGLGYAFQPVQRLGQSSVATIGTSVVVIAGLAIAAMAGLRVGKRVHNAGGLIRIAAYAILLALPMFALALGHPLRPEALRIEPPAPTPFGMNILAKMGFGAFSAFEYVAIFAGESRSPEKSFARSVKLAAPIVTVMFLLGTSAVLAFVAPDDIDLIAPIPQVIRLAAGGTGAAGQAASVVLVLMNLTLLAWGTAAFAGITRLPMVAGWDGLLPEWFTRLSPRSRVPTNSIIFVAAVTALLAIAGLSGVGHQEAYQLFSSVAMMAYALTYVVMFAIPIVGRRTPRVSPLLRVAAASGLAMTLLFIVFAVFPIVAVESRASFGLKVGGLVVGANALGVALFVAGKRRRRA
jgi:glutamate:GABA antiporter